MDRTVYLDNAATTKVDPKVIAAMQPYHSESYGNASSLHRLGRQAKKAVEESRQAISSKLNAASGRLIFTSGGTESNNLAIKGVALAKRKEQDHIITTSTEHDCVLNSIGWLEKNGFKKTIVGVDREGFVDLSQLEDALTEKTALVSIIHGNNEVGTINRLKEVAKIVHSKGALLHTDACQSFTKTELDIDGWGLDLVTVNAHKIHGPKGVGALYVADNIPLQPGQHGGGHEWAMRSGTENVPCIAGFAKAVSISDVSDIPKIEALRDRLISEILEANPGSWLNGPKKERLCNNANISFPHIEGEGMLLYLDQKGVLVSTGSACSSHTLEPSHVLTSMGLPPEECHGAIRFSLSRYTTAEEIDYAIASVNEVAERLRKMSPYD